MSGYHQILTTKPPPPPRHSVSSDQIRSNMAAILNFKLATAKQFV